MKKHKLIAALKKLVEADFKTAKTKFLNELKNSTEISSSDPEQFINDLFKKFKEIKNKNKIKVVQERNIDYWAKQPFTKFLDFVNKLYEAPTSTELKKMPWKQEVAGAVKVAENEWWVIYRIHNHTAAEKLGTLNWCIVRNEDYWDEYRDGGDNSYPECPNNFYFALSKKRSYKVLKSSNDNIEYEDEFHRIAIQVSPKYGRHQQITYWDANDEESNEPPVSDNENLPKFEVDYPDYCDKCNHSVDTCVCCSGGCGYSEDDCHCCDICGDSTDNCDCCRECENTSDDCTCCRECGSNDRDSCGCWCSECGELIDRDCGCDRCSECAELMKNCDCDRCPECDELVKKCTCEEEEEEVVEEKKEKE